MEIGFIGLGHMGFPMARRLVDAGHEVFAFDARREVVDELIALGARQGRSAKEIADRVETVFASLPSPAASLAVATGADGVITGSRVKRFVDLSTTGSEMAQQIHRLLAERGIVTIDSPVSGGTAGAAKGTLAVMVSGPLVDVEVVHPLLEQLGHPFYLGPQPGAAQTMKLVNNLMSAAALSITAEALVMGVKAGLDPSAMIDVINAGSGANSATKDKFPRSVLSGTFDYGFATGLMVKDLRLFQAEAQVLGLTHDVSDAVAHQWETTLQQLGSESDFTEVIKPVEQAAGVVVRKSAQS